MIARQGYPNVNARGGLFRASGPWYKVDIMASALVAANGRIG